jgi:hypothetical protein
MSPDEYLAVMLTGKACPGVQGIAIPLFHMVIREKCEMTTKNKIISSAKKAGTRSYFYKTPLFFYLSPLSRSGNCTHERTVNIEAWYVPALQVTEFQGTQGINEIGNTGIKKPLYPLLTIM